MLANRDEVLQAALGLPESDRLVIASGLLESVPDDPSLGDLDADFVAELERRSGDWEGAVAWKELRDELHSGDR